MTYYPINENAARRAKEMSSFSDYKSGSATAEYKRAVDEAAELAERQKKRVDPMYHAKIDALLEQYSRRLAANINRDNEIGTRCPSILISGGSNFPVRKKQKQVAAWESNAKDYQEVQAILDKIRSVGTGGISSDDPNALDKLRLKLKNLEEHQAWMKAVNAYYRKHKTLEGCPDLSEKTRNSVETAWERGWYRGIPFPPYELSNNNANIRRIRDRISELEKRQTQAPPDGWTFDGGEVVVNTNENRLQIIFAGKPDADVRAELKANGFHWAPSHNAWQRQLNRNAIYAAKHIKAIMPTSGEDIAV